jgi:LPPG:FO 2-phospho-L-lactate transferase
VGAARYLRGLRRVVAPERIVAVVNTGDDATMHGLRISPDLDTVTYTVAGAIDPERGWGLAGETWRAMGAIARYGAVRPAGSSAGDDWFGLGDADLATHMYRTARLAEGATPTRIAGEIARAWGLGETIVPMCDEPVATRVELAEDCAAGRAGDVIGFQDYFVRMRHGVAVRRVEYAGVDAASAGWLARLATADAVVIAPSNPVVSIGPIRALRGVDAALALKGPADRMLAELGHEASVVGVARLYAPVCGTLVVDDADAALADAVRAEGMRCVVTGTVMSDAERAAALARATLEAAGVTA